MHISLLLPQREPKYDGKAKFVPVFAPRWTGPFVIYLIYDRNVYKLRTVPDGGKKVGYLKNPVNGYRLKAYMHSTGGDIAEVNFCTDGH